MPFHVANDFHVAIVGWLVLILLEECMYQTVQLLHCPPLLSPFCASSSLLSLPPPSYLLSFSTSLLHLSLPLPSLPYLLSLFSPTPPSLSAPPPSEVVAEKNTQPKHSEQSKVPSGQNILFIYSMQLDLHNINYVLHCI